MHEQTKNCWDEIVNQLNLKKHDFSSPFFVEHKKFVGGRFSVLSEVGVVPAYLMGIDIIRLRSSIQSFLKGKRLAYLLGFTHFILWPGLP